MIRSTALLLALACCTSALTQTSQKLEFLSSPERAIISEPMRELQSEDPCTIVIDLTIDRSGHVTKSLASAPLSDCADLAMMKKAATLARGLSFEPSPIAPAEQKARLTWKVGPAELIGLDGTVTQEGWDDAAVVDVAPPSVEQDPVYDLASVQEQPQFPGGTEAMYAFLAKEIKYPAEAKEAGIQGKVYLEFMVDRDGMIKEVKVLRGLGAGCSEEAVRAVKAMPKWIPGRMNGKPVPVRWVMPIQFKLQ